MSLVFASPVSVAPDTSLPIPWSGRSQLLTSWLERMLRFSSLEDTSAHPERSPLLAPPLELITQIPFPMFLPRASVDKHRAPQHVAFSCVSLVDNEGLIAGLRGFEQLTRKPSTFHRHGHQQTQTDHSNTTASTWELLASKWLTNTGGSGNKMWVKQVQQSPKKPK